jgi:hypothetical protein
MMDMHSRNQYLKQIRVEYLKTRSKKEKGRLLDESEKRTCLNRKYLIRKLRVLSNLDKKKAKGEWVIGMTSHAKVRRIFLYG